MTDFRPPDLDRSRIPVSVSARQIKEALRALKLGVVKAQRELPEIVDWLGEVRRNDQLPMKWRMEAAKLDREIAELELKQQQDVTHHFVQRRVLVAPNVMESSEAWERKWADVVDVTPAKPDAKPHAAYQAPELPAIPQPEQPHPVRSRPQGHVGGAMPALNLNPSQVFDAGDAKNWRGQTQHMKEVANGS